MENFRKHFKNSIAIILPKVWRLKEQCVYPKLIIVVSLSPTLQSHSLCSD